MAEKRQAVERRRVVIDTNVLAYYLLGVAPFCRDVAAWLAKPVHLVAPESWRPEILSVLWQAVMGGSISLEHALALLEQAEGLIDGSVPVRALWRDTLVLSAECSRSPYDILLVALAQREKTALLTFDQKLLSSFPDIARRPGSN